MKKANQKNLAAQIMTLLNKTYLFKQRNQKNHKINNILNSKIVAIKNKLKEVDPVFIKSNS